MSDEPIRTTPIRYGLIPVTEATAVDGIDYLNGMIAGRFPAPPIARTLNYTLEEVSPGRAVFAGAPTFDFLNPLSGVHGGWHATLLDSALACAVHTLIKAGQGYTTVEMKINYVRPLTPEAGRCVCEGKVIHSGRQIATSEARLVDAKGRLIAHGTETCLIFDMPKV